MILFEQTHYFSATYISIIVFILQIRACVIGDGNTHPENGNRRAESIVRNDGIKHPNNVNRHESGNKDGNNKHERTKLSENDDKKSETGNKKHDDSGSRRYDGNFLRGDGYFAGKPEAGNAVGEIDATESYAELIKSLTTTEHDKYSSTQTERAHIRRTTPFRISLEDDCYYLAYYCLKAYKTGPVCGRTMYYNYQNFKNYCMLDYVNCMEKYEVWQIVHMGQCTNVSTSHDYQVYEFENEDFLDRVFVLQD